MGRNVGAVRGRALTTDQHGGADGYATSRYAMIDERFPWRRPC